MATRPVPFSRDFYLFTVANFLFFLDFASFFLLPLHLAALGAREETIGYVMGTAGFAGIAVLPILGVLLDRVERRGFVIAGTLVMAVASFAFVLVEGPGALLYTLRVIQGVSFTAAFVTSSMLVVELAPTERRGQALGIFGISTSITHAIAPSLGEVVAERFGFSMLFLIASGFGLLAAALTSRIHVRPRRHVPHAEATDPRALGGAPALWLAAASMVACGLGFGAVFTFVPTFIHSIGLERVAPFFVSYTVAAVSVRTILGGLSDRIGRRRVLLPSMAALAVAIFALGMVSTVPGLVAVGLLFGAGQGMTYPTANALMVDFSHAGNLGRVQTLFSGSFSVGVAASAFVFGTVIERLGYRAMFCAAAGCVVVGIALLWRKPRAAVVVSEALEPDGDDVLIEDAAGVAAKNV